MGITSKSQIIDVAAIERGCSQLMDAASEFTTHAATLEGIAGGIGANVLSADKETVDDEILGIATNMKLIEGLVNGIAGSIIAEANYTYAQQLRQYETYLASLEEKN